MLDDIVQFI